MKMGIITENKEFGVQCIHKTMKGVDWSNEKKF